MSTVARQVVSRISVSLPEHLLRQLDGMVVARGFESRSQAIADMINLELTVAQDDLGKVIGKQGRTARAMRSILSAAAARDNKKSRLDILE